MDLLCDLTNDSLKQLNLDILDDIINSMKVMSLSVESICEFYHFDGDKLKQNIFLKHIQCQNNPHFCFWDGMYNDLEYSVLNYLNVGDLLSLSCVSKRFELLVHNSRIIQKNRVQCWFYGSPNHFDGHRLCLGVVVKPPFNDDNCILKDEAHALCLSDEFKSLRKVFSKDYESYFEQLIESIGQYPVLKSIDTTFDLLSSNAFRKHNCRNLLFGGFHNFNDFSRFIPLWIDNNHGKLCRKHLSQCIRKLFPTEYGYHPFLALYCVAVAMSSLIKSVITTSTNNSSNADELPMFVSLDYTRNVIETFFRYYQLLLAIYCQNEKELSPIIQKQMQLFFGPSDNNGNDKSIETDRKCFSDLGVFCMFVPLWKQQEKQNKTKKHANKVEKKEISNGSTSESKLCNKISPQWKNIVGKLLNETLIRQVPSVIENRLKLTKTVYCQDRIWCTWERTEFSRKLFLLQVFFIKQCVSTVYGSNNYLSLHEQLDKYNLNYGFPDNYNLLSIKLQQYVHKIGETCHYPRFFEMIEFSAVCHDFLVLTCFVCLLLLF